MGAKGLTKQVVVETAIRFIEESECGVVSMHEIARRLGGKDPVVVQSHQGQQGVAVRGFSVRN